ncbi:hypothetical protein IEO21_01639 [Rhodonia placenta]|uniref:Ribonuclease P protein subunit n=1 Tax=Rhodonia placenta TaxID=104341 RepID=A0A8H7U603_9APHY|nr:hypothetical protein IEO21_01639 [Postia placenta]
MAALDAAARARMPHNVVAYRDIYTEEHDHTARSPINRRVTLNSSTPFTPTYVKELLAGSADPSQLYTSRVQGRQILLENPVRQSKTRQERAEKKARRLAGKAKKQARSIAPRTARRNGLWRLQPEEMKFELFVPLHQLWMGYMSELLALAPAPATPITQFTSHAVPSAAAMHPKLVKADFHGSLMTVRQSKNPCLVGLSGIVVHETENTFKIITREDRHKLIPKHNTIFSFAVPLYSTDAPTASTGADRTVFDLPHIEFELYGNQFCFRAAERAGRKFKHKETIGL